MERPSELITVSSADFLAGTQVMLASFLDTNPWFTGKIIVLHDDLDAIAQRRLIDDFPQMECREPTDELRNRVSHLVAHYPHLETRQRRFYSLDVIDGAGSETALFVDSDVVFMRSIEDAANYGAALVACGDRATIMGRTRDPATLRETSHASEVPGFRSFNAGLMMIASRLRGTGTRDDVLESLDPDAWASVQSDHTDQAVFNRLFGQQVQLLDEGFNRMVGHGTRMAGAARCPVEDARVLHFNGPAKPWRMDDRVREMMQDADYAFALARWHEAYRRFLARPGRN